MINWIALENAYTQHAKHSDLEHPIQYETVRKVPNELMHCIPRTESILLHQDAQRSYAQDTMLVNRNAKIEELKNEMYLMKHNNERLLATENAKYLNQSSLNANLMQDLGLANKQIKKEKAGKTFWQVVSGILAGVAITLAVTN